MYQIEVKRYLISHMFPAQSGWQVTVDIDAMELGKGSQNKPEKKAIAEKCHQWLQDQQHVELGAHPKYGRVDLVAEKKGWFTFIIEVEGDSSRQREQAIYSALGQIVFLIGEYSDIVRFGLALPDSPKWEALWHKMPEQAKNILDLRLFLVSDKDVRFIEPTKSIPIEIDKMENKLGHMLRRDFHREITAFEHGLDMLMVCVNELHLGKPELLWRVASIDNAEIDLQTKQSFVCLLLLGEGVLRLQAARRLFLSGYISRALASVRDAQEAIIWADICAKDSTQAIQWLKGKKVKRPKNLTLHRAFRPRRTDATFAILNPLGTHSYAHAAILSSMPQQRLIMEMLFPDRFDNNEYNEYKELVSLVLSQMLGLCATSLLYIRECYPEATPKEKNLESIISELIAILKNMV